MEILDCYHLAYPAIANSVAQHRSRHTKRSRAWQPFKIRDAVAWGMVYGELAPYGYRHANTIVNLPPVHGGKPEEVDLRMFAPGSTLLLTTRPCMNDLLLGDRLPIIPSRTNLETLIFDALREFGLLCCGRSKVVLGERLMAIAPGIAARSKMTFRQYQGARYRACENALTGEPLTVPDLERRTAAFLVRIPELWPGGPALLALWGMGGTETLIWARLLSTTHAHLLFDRSFVLAELTGPRTVLPCTTLDFIEHWDVEIVGEAKLPSSPGGPPGTGPIVAEAAQL